MLITSESYGVKSTLLCDWRKKLETSTKAIRCKTKNNCDLQLVSWIFFPSSFLVFTLIPDWLKIMLTFVLICLWDYFVF